MSQINEGQAKETCPAELPNWCAQRHWSIFWILIVCSVALVLGKVLCLGDSLSREGRPFFSANDRSRWLTVRSLGDFGKFEIDSILQAPGGRSWDSIDKVRLVGRDGQFHYYSSKPPLLSLLVAGGYVGLKSLTGWEIATETNWVVRSLLVLFNVFPWGVFLWFLARMINAIPVRDWTRYYVLACGCFGTFLLPFTITLNNHLPAAVCVMIALYCVAELTRRPSAGMRFYLAAGLFSTLAATFELPALIFLACVGLICLLRSLKQTCVGFLPASLLVLALFLATNWLAFGQWKPAYFQRQDGRVVATIGGDFDQLLDQGELPGEFRAASPATLTRPLVQAGEWPGTPPHYRRWVVRDELSVSQLAILRDTTQIEGNYQIREWGNWYDYPGSYWLTSNDAKKSKVDLGVAQAELYAFHLLIGHHGIFSLTPIWLFSYAGMLALLGGVKFAGRYSMRWLGWTSLTISLIVIGFYLTRPEMDRNYGGYCCTARWLLWLTPIWLVTMAPIVDWLAGSRWGKGLCFLLLGFSITSAALSANNPWVLPWLYNIWEITGLPL
jgi:hypothetical protein